MGERHHTLVSVCGGTRGDGMLDAILRFPIVARPFVLKSIAIVVRDTRLWHASHEAAQLRALPCRLIPKYRRHHRPIDSASRLMPFVCRT